MSIIHKMAFKLLPIDAIQSKFKLLLLFLHEKLKLFLITLLLPFSSSTKSLSSLFTSMLYLSSPLSPNFKSLRSAAESSSLLLLLFRQRKNQQQHKQQFQQQQRHQNHSQSLYSSINLFTTVSILLFMLMLNISLIETHTFNQHQLPLSNKILSPSCGDVLCIHGSCDNGKCVCEKGWQGSACHRCGGRVRLTKENGFISDGISNYSTDLQCTWLIDSESSSSASSSLSSTVIAALDNTEGAYSEIVNNKASAATALAAADNNNNNNKRIIFNFIEFETECSWDHLYIFDGDSVFSPLLGAFSGLLIKNGHQFIDLPIVKTTNKRAYLYFYSDVAYNMTGFNISYSINQCFKNCSSHGVCIDGFCTCDGGRFGDYCEREECPNNCLPYGECKDVGSSRKCSCKDEWTGDACNQRKAYGYWKVVNQNFNNVYNDDDGNEQESKNNDKMKIFSRSLHQAIVYKDDMYIAGGEAFGVQLINEKFLIKFNLIDQQWSTVAVKDDNQIPKIVFGHSLVLYKEKLYLYGGILRNGTVVSDLWTYDLKENKWSLIEITNARPCLTYYCSPLASIGHTANVVFETMVVIFGHNPIYGYLNSVQEYNFSTGKWTMIQTKGAIVKGGFGHSSVYDHVTDTIYVFGGYHSNLSESILVDLLYGFDYKKKSWKLLNPSQSSRYLHSAVIMNNIMYVFGGNGHNSTDDSAGDKCFSSSFIAYDILCDKWLHLTDPVLSLQTGVNIGRYGHTAIVHENNMYIYGGYNGMMLNKILKYTEADCKLYKNKNECSHSTPIKCSWNYERNVCERITVSHQNSFHLTKNNCRPNHFNYSELCTKQTTCQSCVENSYGCVWCGDTCQHQRCSLITMSGINGDSSKCDSIVTPICDKLHNCHACHTEYQCSWQKENRCITNARDYGNRTSKVILHEDFKLMCEAPCYERTSCENCTLGPCMWCSSTRQCIESNAYAAVFPVSQCMEWTIHSSKCSSLSCSELQTCDKCLRNPRCGWCDDGSQTGVGVCLDGSAEAPYVWNASMYQKATDMCKSANWYFTECPACQCNGHSTCEFGSSVCRTPCKNLTEGSQCQYCQIGYYGNPINGGNCTACSCHNHSFFCQRETGKCHCTTKGIVGHHCDRCDEQNQYFGNPTEEGGSCYYNLSIDYQYTFNMSKPDDRYFKRINFMNVPSKTDVDVEFTITCSESAYVNVSIGSATLPFRILAEREECNSIKRKFPHDENLFGIQNTTFYVHVFGFSTPILIQISFSQHRTLDLLQFFVTFSSCFLSLFVIAAILWKVKQKYDLYRRRQQLFLELEHMASRPFAGIVAYLDDDLNTKTNNPTPIALEPCSNGKAAVLSLILRLPTGGMGFTPPGQTGLGIASALVSLGITDQKLNKDNEISQHQQQSVKNSVKFSNNATGV